MSLQFIIGSAGSGKTYHLYKELIRMSMEQEQYNYIAIVPEQATLQTQKDIVNMHPRHGVFNIDILSFERLAYRVFEELGCTPKRVLDDVGKNMLLRKAFSKVSKDLKVYGKNLKKAGFIDEVKSLFSELYQYRIEPDDLEKMIGQTTDKPLLNRKLQDILLLDKAFRECMGEDMVAAEEVLKILSDVIGWSEIMKNSIVTLDGFTGFTPVQYEVIRKLLKLAKKVVITVTVDERENPYDVKGSHTLFYLSRKTIDRLNTIAAQEGVARDNDIRIGGTPYRFKDSAPLAFLEKEMLRYPFNTCDDCSGISVHALANPQAEAAFVAEEICRLVRVEKLRYRDIGVIVTDITTYKPYLVRYFGESGIPFFLDDKKSLIANPLVEYIRAVIEVVTRDFDYQSVFRYLKCGFCEAHSDAVFEMENYVLARGIRGINAWKQEWEPLYAGGEHLNMEWLNSEKKELLSPVFELAGALKGEDGLTVSSAIRSLYDWLEGQYADGMLDKMAEEFEGQGEYALAKEYSQAYGMVLELFDRLMMLAPDEHISVKELSQVLDAGFEKIKVGMIPAGIDRIMVGDVTRSRLKDIRHLFFMGMNDCFIPKANDSGGILSELDRDMLSAIGIELSPGARESSFIERLYVYLALTKPQDGLMISFSKSSMAGKGLRPSSYLKSVTKLFEGMQIIDEDENKDLFRKIISREAALKLLIDGLRDYDNARENSSWLELYGWFHRDIESAESLKFLLDNAFFTYRGESIGRELASKLYGSEITGSVTRMEQYAACAYAQFLSYGLKLGERRKYEFAAVDMGNMFHSSIENYFKFLRDDKQALSELTEEKRIEYVKKSVEKAYENNSISVLKSTSRNQYMLKRIERVVDKTVWALAEQINKGSFEPAGFEVQFGNSNDAMVITLDEGETMRLRGKVDRIDTCKNGDDILVRIIDYKTGTQDFEAAKVYNGLQIQLVVYLDAVMRREKLLNHDKNVRVAGMFYYNISDPVIDSDTAALPKELALLEALGKLKLKGLVNNDTEVIRLLDSDIDGSSNVIPVTLKDGEVNEKKSDVASDIQFTSLIEHVQENIRHSANEMAGGNITAAPYRLGKHTGCDYCRFKSVCGFDLRIPGYAYRRLNSFGNEELWQKLAAQAAEETAPAEKSIVPAAEETAPAEKSIASAAEEAAPAEKSIAPAAKENSVADIENFIGKEDGV